jgi:hypothetical protein
MKLQLLAVLMYDYNAATSQVLIERAKADPEAH